MDANIQVGDQAFEAIDQVLEDVDKEITNLYDMLNNFTNEYFREKE